MLTLTSQNRHQVQRDRRIRRTGILGCLTVLLTSGIVATAANADEIYRWVDADGVVNYTQQKPRDVQAQALTTQRGAPTRVRNAAAIPAGPPGEALEDPAMSDAQQRMLDELQAKEQQRQQEVAEIREQNCQKSRRILDDLSATERIRVRGNNGQERIMPEDERQRRISEAQRGVVDNCASA